MRVSRGSTSRRTRPLSEEKASPNDHAEKDKVVRCCAAHRYHRFVISPKQWLDISMCVYDQPLRSCAVAVERISQGGWKDSSSYLEVLRRSDCQSAIGKTAVEAAAAGRGGGVCDSSHHLERCWWRAPPVDRATVAGLMVFSVVRCAWEGEKYCHGRSYYCCCCCYCCCRCCCRCSGRCCNWRPSGVLEGLGDESPTKHQSSVATRLQVIGRLSGRWRSSNSNRK